MEKNHIKNKTQNGKKTRLHINLCLLKLDYMLENINTDTTECGFFLEMGNFSLQYPFTCMR